MFITVTESMFHDAFKSHDCMANFSREACTLLFNMIEELEEGSGEPIELDIVALCCDYSESTLEDINMDYGQEFETLEEVEEWLQDNTFVVGTAKDTIVYAAF